MMTSRALAPGHCSRRRTQRHRIEDAYIITLNLQTFSMTMAAFVYPSMPKHVMSALR